MRAIESRVRQLERAVPPPRDGCDVCRKLLAESRYQPSQPGTAAIIFPWDEPDTPESCPECGRQLRVRIIWPEDAK